MQTFNEQVLFIDITSNSTNGQIDDLSVTSNVVRFSAADLLTGMAPANAGQVVLLVNTNSTDDLVIGMEHASSTAANRFAGTGTSRVLRPDEMALAWYDTGSGRWRLLIRDDVSL